MLVRIFEGGSWTAASPLGDFEFEKIPSAGHKLVIAAESGWASGVVADVVHRITDARDAADIALLIGAMMTTSDQSDLPFADLDRLSGGGNVASPAAPAPSRPSPWR